MLKIEDSNASLTRDEVVCNLSRARNDLIKLQIALQKQLSNNEELDEAFRDLFPVFDALIYTVKIMKL